MVLYVIFSNLYAIIISSCRVDTITGTGASILPIMWRLIYIYWIEKSEKREVLKINRKSQKTTCPRRRVTPTYRSRRVPEGIPLSCEYFTLMNLPTI